MGGGGIAATPIVVRRRREPCLGFSVCSGFETDKASGRNRFVTEFVFRGQEALTEMTPVRAALLSLAMLAAIVVGGIGIYAADASNGHAVIDGYGVTAALR